MWGATQCVQLGHIHGVISIHAPRVGCDYRILGDTQQSHRFQSTHPVWGATLGLVYLRCPVQFQSTHPVWGATICEMDFRQEISNFNPRTPCGVRRASSSPTGSMRRYFNPRTPCGVRPAGLSFQSLAVSRFQSTHPVWGATLIHGVVLPINDHISIHAPRVGCDATSKSCFAHRLKISIHAPRVGCDQVQRAVNTMAKTFQSTHPVWGATWPRKPP